MMVIFTSLLSLFVASELMVKGLLFPRAKKVGWVGWDGGPCGMSGNNSWLFNQWIDLEEDNGCVAEASFLKTTGHMTAINSREAEI